MSRKARRRGRGEDRGSADGAAMTAKPTLTWSDELVLQQPRMDATHREFVDRLAALEAALARGPAAVDTALAALAEHTVEHFEQEERWMAALGFAPENCHTLQHAAVLSVLREVQRLHADSPGAPQVRRLVAELTPWFTAHAQMMDAALAQTMVERGYDPETGEIANPPAPEAELITGCGGATCS
jgi:hemerythrin